MSGNKRGKGSAGLLLLALLVIMLLRSGGGKTRTNITVPQIKNETAVQAAGALHIATENTVRQTAYRSNAAADTQKIIATFKPTAKQSLASTPKSALTSKPAATLKSTPQPTATPQRYTVPPQIASASLLPGDNNDAILQIKQKMQRLGYFREGAELSGRYNDTMTERVMLFQANNGLPQTGKIDMAFLTALYGPMPVTNGALAATGAVKAGGSDQKTEAAKNEKKTAADSKTSVSSSKKTASSNKNSNESSKKTSSSNKNAEESVAIDKLAPYIGNRNSKKFHRSNCRDVKKMKESNKVPLYSRQEAIGKGYSPCGHCHP